MAKPIKKIVQDLYIETFIIQASELQSIASLGVDLIPSPGVGLAIVASELSTVKYLKGSETFGGYPELRLTTSTFNQAQLHQETLIPSDESGSAKFYTVTSAPGNENVSQINTNAGLRLVGDIDSSTGDGAAELTIIYTVIAE
tara:strand:+ start:122392 stop:122820 length:429 start_codon:yes stop_codon:yes gene_type:complete